MLKTLDSLPLEKLHREALNWFWSRRGRQVPWAELQAHATTGARLVNQAKGIYKPAYTEYALSLRTLQDGPYPDKAPEYRPDGSWVLQYFQENPDPRLRDREATNRGLMLCMRDRVPIGALVKRRPAPGVAYEVLGLGLVTDWSDGYFTIEGFASDGPARHERDAAYDRAQFSNFNENPEEFDAANDQDLRARNLRLIAQRRGQAKFRARLLEAYRGGCCVSGCDVIDVLEAAHISAYRGVHSHHPQNGLLLRGDLHTLFDLGLLAIAADYRVALAPRIAASEPYRALAGRKIHLPDQEADRPSLEALRRHREWARL